MKEEYIEFKQVRQEEHGEETTIYRVNNVDMNVYDVLEHFKKFLIALGFDDNHVEAIIFGEFNVTL